jgi:hypothetical protein
MKDKVMRPFRAPRIAADKSGTATGKEGVIWKPLIIPETQHLEEGHVREILQNGAEIDERIDRKEMARAGNGCRLTLAMVDATAEEGTHLVRLALPPLAASPKGEMAAYKVASPSISEFETWLGAREVLPNQCDKNGRGDTALLQLQRPTNMSNEAWFASVLLSEQKRLEVDQNSRLVELKDILPDADSSDDDIPIVDTLKPKKTKPKPKMKLKERWTYEAVAEPTGIASKYWDASAPKERTTKKLAKEKLSALKVAETKTKGAPNFHLIIDPYVMLCISTKLFERFC